MIGKIAVSAANYAIDKPYSYLIPEGMELQPGMRVTVPFGRGNRRCEGVVLSLEAVESGELKTVEQRLDEQPLLSHRSLKMAAFLRERYFCTFYDAIRAMLPAGLWFQSKETVSLTEDRSWKENCKRQPDALALLRFLEDCGGQTEESSLRQVLPEEENTFEIFHTFASFTFS